MLHGCLCCGFSCSVYGEAIPVKELAERVASYVHLCTLYWWLRLAYKLIARGILLVSWSFFFPLFIHVGDLLTLMQTVWMWSNPWRLWQRWTAVVHGRTIWRFLCELLFIYSFFSSIFFLVLRFSQLSSTDLAFGISSRGTLVLQLGRAGKLLKRKSK